ncbi:hypothetical protein [Aurantimonas marina]|uniref:hypothetical protein n=1 Tax=Aurantimonas marina TaxID=2780508 RepID=UPI0019CF61EE|nr:hypothetical protein [Aurantimonas marina]
MKADAAQYPTMTADEFLVRAESCGEGGRYELLEIIRCGYRPSVSVIQRRNYRS